MESSIVIKVKYGKTLRRFNACIDEAGKLELSLDGLLERVFSLFSLSPEADVSLTYLDEDGDLVTLADDEDMIDVMRQSLNPLRITVELNSEKDSSSNARSSGNSTPVRPSPEASEPLLDLSSTVSEIFKAVPEPLGEALSKLSLDQASKAPTSSGQLPEAVLHFSEMLQSYMIPVSDSQAGKVSGARSAGPESSTPSLMTKEPEASGGDGAKPNIVTFPSSLDQAFRYMKKVDPISAKPNAVTLPSPLNVHADHRGEELVMKSGESSLNAEAVEPAWGNIKTSVIGTDEQVMKPGGGLGSLGVGASPVDPNTSWNQNTALKTINHEESTNGGHFNQSIAGKCPFSGIPAVNGLAIPLTHFAPPFKRGLSQGGQAGIFHRGVCCDVCGVNPITGPRFKSKVKEDYDLCSFCFAEMGSEAEYIRLDRPAPYRHPHPFKGIYDFNARVNPPLTLPQALRDVIKPNQPKLDSQFITDVNVIDGTMMAPSTPFTKIWRMRNNGTLAWPQGTQVVWIGGDRLSASLSAGVQIPDDGLAVENELEIAVDFTAPELPGRYISHWQMASPSGQEFGQCLWVLIQVDSSEKDSTCSNNWQGLNLNLPPESSGFNIAESVPVNVGPIVINGRLPNPEYSNRATDLVEPLVVPLPTKDKDLDFPINNNLLVIGTTAPLEWGPAKVSYPTVDTASLEWGPAKVSYPTVDSSAIPLVSLAPLTPPVVSESSAQASGEKDEVEQILLMELEEMGFKQVDLNKEVLRMNEYNLEQSLDALCGVSEWNPVLEQLQEMGFFDNELNKKLLKKNNGSIKGVVMDLITGEKA